MLLAAMAMSLVACGSSSTGHPIPRSVISPADALKVAQRELPQVLNANDVTLIDRLFESPSAEIQKAAIVSNAIQNIPGVTDIKAAAVKVFAAPQVLYPAQFLATFEVSSAQLKIANGVEAAVFVQRAAGAPWKVHSLNPIDADVSLPTITTDTNGFARMPAASTSLRVKPSALCSRAADLLALASSGGDYNNVATLKPYSTGTTMAYWLNFVKNRTATLAAGGSSSSDQFSADDSLVTDYAIAGGGVVQACILEETFRETAPVGKAYTQLDNRANLGTLVPPGSYQAVTYHAFYRVLVHLPAEVGDTLSFLGVTSFTVSGTPT